MMTHRGEAGADAVTGAAGLDEATLELLRCPVTGERLRREGPDLVTISGTQRYRIDTAGIPLFAERFCSEEGRAQERHYDRIARVYLENLSYPHTQEYSQYLDRVFLDQFPAASLGTVAEICCGRGEAFHLLKGRLARGVGVDVSLSMLRAARHDFAGDRFVFVQGDATGLPLADGVFDNVVMLGGIHHVNARQQLFSEIHRILKPGGRFYWREPLNDFLPWRLIRKVVYRLSPTLDHQTERPLLQEETLPPLRKAGFEVKAWRGCGFLGFCLLMNSDVLVVNRLFRFVPGIRAFTRVMANLDDLMLRWPGLRRAGLLVVGVAEKPR